MTICKICGKELEKVKECAWTACEKWTTEWDEKRIDQIGQNGNEGLHYDPEYMIISEEAKKALLETKKWYDDLFSPEGLTNIKGFRNEI